MSAVPALDPLATIERDVRRAAATLGRDEARFLVDTYYSLQDFRIASTNQVRSIVRSGAEEPHETLRFFSTQFNTLEKQIHGALDQYSNAHVAGQWARANVGIGPVIAAGLLAHIDIERARFASSVWRFAGLMPGQRKQKGVKRDWNAQLKVLCWKIGDSFVKFHNNEKCYYGHLYVERKLYEIRRDELGENAEAAKRVLEQRNIQEKTTRAIYESGHLPPGQLDMRARRYAVKRFLEHFWECLYVVHYHKQPPHPYVEEWMGHTDIERPPVPLPQP